MFYHGPAHVLVSFVSPERDGPVFVASCHKNRDSPSLIGPFATSAARMRRGPRTWMVPSLRCSGMSRLIAIGDVHGCATALEALLAAIAPQPADTLVFLGDYVDRGPDSARVLERMVDLVSRCHLVPLIGNHELMMVKASESQGSLEFWKHNGGQSTLACYGGRLSNVPQDHWMFLQHCVRYFQSDDHLFVHACYDPQLPLEEQLESVLLWTHIFDVPPPPHVSGKRAIVGHTPQADFEIADYGHVVILDTYCVGGGWLSALDVRTGQLWQANQRGELRAQPAADSSRRRS